MIATRMKTALQGSSAIRAMFEEGSQIAKQYGAENVYDFSLGNPNLPAPPEVKQAIFEILEQENPVLVHGYMNNSGYEDVRETIAQSLNRRFGTQFDAENIIMTVGAAGGLHIAFQALVNPEDEIIAIAPFFGEYRHYTQNAGAKLVIVPPNIPTFQPDLAALEACITPKTRGVIINTPNNPTGVVYSEQTIQALADLLRRKQNEFGTEIFLFADEPYRELVYDKDTVVPYVTKYYENTIVGYSWSKSLSLPGERIGYLVVPAAFADFANTIEALNTATRIFGFVNAPSLMQRVAAKCVDVTADISFYQRNRDVLYNGLTAIGYTCAKPEGAFYLWVKTPIPDTDFVQLAKKYQILTVPGSAFACPGYVRLAYCVSHETVQNAIPKFQMLWNEIQNL